MRRVARTSPTWGHVAAVMEAVALSVPEGCTIRFRLLAEADEVPGTALNVSRPPSTRSEMSFWGVLDAVDPRVPSRHIHFVRARSGLVARVTAADATARVELGGLIPDVEREARRDGLVLPTCLVIPEASEAWTAAQACDGDTGLPFTAGLLEAMFPDPEDSPGGRGDLVAVLFDEAATDGRLGVVFFGEEWFALDPGVVREAVDETVTRMAARLTSPAAVRIRARLRIDNEPVLAEQVDPGICGRQVLAEPRSRGHAEGLEAAEKKLLQPLTRKAGPPAPDAHTDLVDAIDRQDVRRKAAAGIRNIGSFAVAIAGTVTKVTPGADGSNALTITSPQGGTVRLHLPAEVAARYPQQLLTPGSGLCAQAAMQPDVRHPRLEVALLSSQEQEPTPFGTGWLLLPPPAWIPTRSDPAQLAPIVATERGIDPGWLTEAVHALRVTPPRPRSPRGTVGKLWWRLTQDPDYRAWVEGRPHALPAAFRQPAYLPDRVRKLDAWCIHLDESHIPALAGLLIYCPWLWEEALSAGLDLVRLLQLEAVHGIGRTEQLLGREPP
jgi:hypothetical protein